MGTMRKLKRQVDKNKKELVYKKVVSRKLGITTKELNKRFFKEGKKDECEI